MNFVFGLDESFAMPTGIAMRSLDRFLTRDDRVLALHLGLSGVSVDRLEACVTHATFSEVDCSEMTHAAWRTPTAYLSQAAFLRLLAPEILAAEARCVYLDGDVLIRHEPAPLHDADLSGKSIGAVRSRTTAFLGSPDGIQQWQELGLPSAAPYFNSGVMVMDLDRWRSVDLTKRATDFLEVFGDETSLADQDAINVAAVGDWTELDRRWNYVTYVTQYFMQQPEVEPYDPSIIHFAGRSKPWTGGRQPIFAEEWHALLCESPWVGFEPPAPPQGARPWLKRQVGRALRKARDLSRAT